jgi:hypothetical protein
MEPLSTEMLPEANRDLDPMTSRIRTLADLDEEGTIWKNYVEMHPEPGAAGSATDSLRQCRDVLLSVELMVLDAAVVATTAESRNIGASRARVFLQGALVQWLGRDPSTLMVVGSMPEPVRIAVGMPLLIRELATRPELVCLGWMGENVVLHHRLAQATSRIEELEAEVALLRATSSEPSEIDLTTGRPKP